MLYGVIGKLFNIRTIPISDNRNVKRDLWTLNDNKYNIISQTDYPFIYDESSIQELLIKFNEGKFKDISSMNLFPKQKNFDPSLYKLPDSKRDPSDHSKVYNYSLTALEEDNDPKISKNDNNDTLKRTKKKKHRKKYFKIQLNDMDKKRSIKFDLHPMVEEFMIRTIDKLTANMPKEKENKRKTMRESDYEDEEEEIREKSRIMQVLRDLQKEEEERKKQSSHLLSVSSNLRKSDDLLMEDGDAETAQQKRLPSTLRKSVRLSAAKQSNADHKPTSGKSEVPVVEGDVNELERELSVFDPEFTGSSATHYTRPPSVNALADIEKKDDSDRDKAITKDMYKKIGGKKTNDLGEEIIEFDKTQLNKTVNSIDKSTSSHDLTKKDATTITEPNSKTKSTEQRKNLHFTDADHIAYPLYNIEASRTENNICKQIEISRLKKDKEINTIENNNLLNFERTGKNTTTDLQFTHQNIPNKDVLYFNYKSSLLQIKLKEFLQNKLEEKRKHLICSRSTGNLEIPYSLNRENIENFPKIKEANSFSYNSMKNNIMKKQSRISTIKKSRIIRKLAATCAYPLIKSTIVGVAKSYNKGNKLYFNTKVLLNAENTNANQCVNGINKKNEIAQTLRRINSLKEASDNLENFLKGLNVVEDDEPRIATIISSRFKENRTKGGGSNNSGKQKHSVDIRNEPPDNVNISKNSQHIIMPVYISIDTLNNENGDSSENENSNETNSVTSKTFQKTIMIPAAHKRVYLENFRKPNKETVNKIVKAEQSKQHYNNSFSLNTNADGEQKEIESMKLYNSISQCLTSKKIIESTMFMRKENSIEQRIDYDLATQKQETCNVRNSEKMYEILHITGSNAVTESNYLLSNENNSSNNQSTIKLNVQCQNFKTVEFNSYTDLYTNKIIIPKYMDNFIVTEEHTGQENCVKNENKDANDFFDQQSVTGEQKNSNHSKPSVSNSNGSNNYFKHKKTVQILQENQVYETTGTVKQRKPSSIEIYETCSKNTISQSSGTPKSTQQFCGNLSNSSTIVCKKIKSSYTDTIYTNDMLNSGYSKHEEVYSANIDQNNEKIVKNTIEDIPPLFNLEEYDIYTTGNSTNKLSRIKDCTPSAISKNEYSNFSNQTGIPESDTMLFCLNSEFYVNGTNTNKSMNVMMNNTKLDNKTSSDTSDETLSHQCKDKTVNYLNNKGDYFKREINKENFKQTTDDSNKSIVNFDDDFFEKSIRNSISIVYV